MSFKEYLKELNDAIDPMAAVLIAHTKPDSHVDAKSHVDYTKMAAMHFKKHTPVSVDNLKSILGHNHLELKSAHPQALDNLHSNLMKVTEPINTESINDDVRVHQLFNKGNIGSVLHSLDTVMRSLTAGDNLTKLKYVKDYLLNLNSNLDRIKSKNFN